MEQSIVSILLLLCFLCTAFADEIPLDEKTIVHFASIEAARRVLATRDDFVARMSEFDRVARMKSDRPVSEREFLAFAASNAMSWEDDEIEKVKIAIKKIKPKIAQLKLRLPKSILLIKTTGKEEGGAAYTRSNAVILPRRIISTRKDLHRLIAHEIFHVFTRHNPDICESLYAAIGFAPCGEIDFPEVLKPRKITNPDAPKNNYYIEVSHNEKLVWVVPILFSRETKYDVKRGGEFFNYLTLKLLVVEKKADRVEPKYSDGRPVLLDLATVSGFFSKVGRNTSYIIHPEEILADNFAHLVTGTKNLPSPQIIEMIEQILTRHSDNIPDKVLESDDK